MRLGIVLSGGVAKGAYQAGFLKAFEKLYGRDNISCVSGASIGALNGYAFCADKTEHIYDIWKSIHFDSVSDVMHNVWFHHFLSDSVHSIVSENDELKIPLYVPICYYPIVHLNYCRLYGKYNKKWYNFMRGAISFPFIAGAPKFFNGQPVIDGGAMDNIPILPLVKGERPDMIIVLHFSAGFRPRKILLDDGIPIVDFDVSITNKFRKHSFDFHNQTISSMLESGEKYAEEIYGNIFENAETLEELLKRASVQTEKESDERFNNYTFETWVDRLNEVFYPFLRHDGSNLKDISSKQKKKRN